MSTITDALEAEVAGFCAVRRAAAGRTLHPRERAAMDRHFARLLRLIAPRIRHFTRAYGLVDVADDAAQACAIGLFRAIEAFDPLRARFTTFVNWQLRGELQGLRFRLRHDSRESARKAGAVTVSLDALGDAADGWQIADADALARTEALAAETMARRACGRLLDDHYALTRRMALHQIERRAHPRAGAAVRPGTIDPRESGRIEARLRRERAIVSAHILGDGEDIATGDRHTPEQRRQIVRRTLRALAERVRGNGRYDPDVAGMGAGVRH
jgi:Sigma-70 region 2